MTLKELGQYRALKKEIEDLKNRIAKLRCAAENTTQNITGMPFTGGISDKTAIAAEIADAVVDLEERREKAAKEYNRLTKYITTIEDSYIRQIFTLRFIDGKSCREVAIKIGGGNTENNIWQICFRHIKKTCNESNE